MNNLIIVIGAILWFGSAYFAVYEYISSGVMFLCWIIGMLLIGVGTNNN